MIGVVDYGRGNLFSIRHALEHLGLPNVISADPDVLAATDRILLPGVGAFGDAIAALHQRGLFAMLQDTARAGKPLVGICLGMQLLADEGFEFGRHEGLGLIPGSVSRLPEGNGEDRVRIPNVGWRELHHAGNDPWFDGRNSSTLCYFVHSFEFKTEAPEDTAATITLNGAEVAAIVRRKNVSGFQCHPEKSGPAGLALLKSSLTQ